jgi:hypothetical protein
VFFNIPVVGYVVVHLGRIPQIHSEKVHRVLPVKILSTFFSLDLYSFLSSFARIILYLVGKNHGAKHTLLRGRFFIP